MEDLILKYKKIYRSKQYIDLMRQGIDPVSGENVPDDSVICNEKVKSCFNFISELLDEMLTDYEPQTDKKTEPFHLTDQQIRKVKITAMPIAITTFIARINKTLDKNTTKHIRTKDITGWLVHKGFVEPKTVKIVKEQTEYIPLETADKIGVFDVIKHSNNGNSDQHCLKLDQIGQQFIIDNIDEISQYITDTSGM